MDQLNLCKCRVLYLGSAIPLETAVGIEALQNPCRDRYLQNVDSGNRASGIDTVLTVYSSGMMLQYTGDDASQNWFPIQNLQVCAAVKAVSGAGALRFVSLDTPTACRSQNPPMFACIMRRPKGIKVLECHVFICKSNQAALALVQSCTHAYQHREGWGSEAAGGGARIVSAGGGGAGNPFNDNMDLVQKFDVNCRIGNGGMVAMNPPGAPVGLPVPQMGGAYFADWGNSASPLMIIPQSPFYPGAAALCQNKKKKKKKKKSKKGDSSDEEETTYIRRPGKRPEVVVVPPPPKENQQNPKSDVIVYAPQVIEANKSYRNYQADDRMTDLVNYHPEKREFRQNNDGRVYDGRADNRILYNRQDLRRADYRADQRSFRNAEDNRRLDYRADNRIAYTQPEEEEFGYYRGGGGGGGQCGGGGGQCERDEWERGYYNAQVEAYNDYLRRAEAGGDYDDYYPEGYDYSGYYPQPGYTDDYGSGFAVEGYGGGGYGQPAAGYGQVASGLGYYP